MFQNIIKFAIKESLGWVVKKTVWKAKRAWFLDLRKRRAKPGIELFLTRWGKNSVF